MKNLTALVNLVALIYVVSTIYKEIKAYVIKKQKTNEQKPFWNALAKAKTFPMNKISWDTPEVNNNTSHGVIVQGPATITVYDEDGQLIKSQLFPKSLILFPSLKTLEADHPQDVTKAQAVKKIECIGYEEKYNSMQVQYESGMTVGFSNY